MEKKTCSKCKEEKLMSDYYKSTSAKTGKTKTYSCCKVCSYKVGKASLDKHRDRANKKHRETYKSNPEVKRRHAKTYAQKHPEKKKEMWQNWYVKNRENQILKASEYAKNNRDKINIRNSKKQKEKFKTDKMFNIKHSIRTRTYRAFNQKRWNKGKSTEQLLGTTYDVAKQHIERQFIKGMSWKNRGDWHIDHKIPLASAKTEEDLRLLCHYTNLQPLWQKDNNEKKDKILPTQMTLTI